MARRLAKRDVVVSSPLLEAELFSTLVREGRLVSDEWSSAIQLVIVDRSLTEELKRVLAFGHVRGADCWHLATALYVAPHASDLTFVTLGLPQRRVARAMGFMT